MRKPDTGRKTQVMYFISETGATSASVPDAATKTIIKAMEVAGYRQCSYVEFKAKRHEQQLSERKEARRAERSERVSRG